MSFNLTAVVLAGALVVLMQAGFALVSTGLCRAKNAAQVITMNLLIFVLSVLGFWVFGFAILSGGWSGTLGVPISQWAVHLFGHPFGFMGARGFFLNSTGGDPAVYALFFFQALVISLAAVIPSGVMAERWKLANLVLYGMVAGAAAAGAWMTVKSRKPDPSMVCSGLLAGLVAISASCAFVNPAGAVITGAVAGLLVVYAVLFFEGTMKVDDPMGALSVPGVGGVWGVLSLGLLADGSFGANWNGVQDKAGVAGAFATVFGGAANDWGKMLAQIIGALSCLVFFGLAAWLWFKVSNRFVPLRTRREDELGGLDLPEVGAECNPDFHLTDKGASRSE